MNSRKVRRMSTIALLLGSVFLSAQTTRDIRPVTDAMLQTPDAGEWLNWRSAQNTWGYSALNRDQQAECRPPSAGVVLGAEHGREPARAARP